MNIEISRSIPVNYAADIVIAGAGMAGVCAAVAAAKQGCKVILIERFAIPGGSGTSGGVAAI